MSDDRAIVYFDPKVEAWVYRASSVGRSLRTLSAARQGYDPLPDPDYLVEAAEAGNRFEVIVKARLRESGYRISGEQGELAVEVMPGVLIRGHLDASHCLAPDDATDRILEVKSMSDRVYRSWIVNGFAGFPEYAAQVTTYMAVEAQRRGSPTPIPATYAVVNRETNDLDIRQLDTPPADFATLTQRVMLVEQFARMNQLPTCDSTSKYTCPYDYICDRHDIMFEEIEAGTEAMLIDLGNRWTAAHEMVKAAEDKKADITAQIATALGVREELLVDGFTFTNKAPKPRKTLNITRLRARLGDELDDYFEESEVRKSVRVYPRKSDSPKKEAT